LLETIRDLCKMPIQQAPQRVLCSGQFTRDAHLLKEFLRYVCNSWRNFDRFLNLRFRE